MPSRASSTQRRGMSEMSDYSFQVQVITEYVHSALNRVEEIAAEQPTLRDRFAIATMSAFDMHPNWADDDGQAYEIAQGAYRMADALMRVRGEE